jgi:hypothetical protein
MARRTLAGQTTLVVLTATLLAIAWQTPLSFVALVVAAAITTSAGFACLLRVPAALRRHEPLLRQAGTPIALMIAAIAGTVAGGLVFQARFAAAQRTAEELVPLLESERERGGTYPVSLSDVEGARRPDSFAESGFYETTAARDSFRLWLTHRTWLPGASWKSGSLYDSRTGQWVELD